MRINFSCPRVQDGGSGTPPRIKLEITEGTLSAVQFKALRDHFPQDFHVSASSGENVVLELHIGHKSGHDQIDEFGLEITPNPESADDEVSVSIVASLEFNIETAPDWELTVWLDPNQKMNIRFPEPSQGGTGDGKEVINFIGSGLVGN